MWYNDPVNVDDLNTDISARQRYIHLHVTIKNK